MSIIVATNVVASRPPERRPTGTQHARANSKSNAEGPIQEALKSAETHPAAKKG